MLHAWQVCAVLVTLHCSRLAWQLQQLQTLQSLRQPMQSYSFRRVRIVADG
jgi:hypothetical protein